MRMTHWKTSLLVAGVVIPSTTRDVGTLDGNLFRTGDEIPLPIHATEPLRESGDTGNVHGHCDPSQPPD